MRGLKPVRHRRQDALARVGWDRLELLLAAYYQGEGFEVEHVGTAASGTRFDGGIDLKLRRGDASLVVQCKHWNAMKVPHNAVHELLGLMVNHGATGAILVTSGEFTRAAIEAANRRNDVRLVDGDELRMMLGPLPDIASPADAHRRRVTEGRAHRPSPGRRAASAGRALRRLAARFVFVAFVVALFIGFVRAVVSPLLKPERSTPAHPTTSPASAGGRPAAVHADPQAGRRNDPDAAIEVIDDSTPEL